MSAAERLHAEVLFPQGLSESRQVWTQPAYAAAPQFAALFLDAELYIDRVQAPSIVQQLQGDGAISPLLAVYVSNKDAATRHVDYTCNERYADFIVNEVIPWILMQHPGLDSTNLVLVGLSLSGLAAADIARRYPGRFRAVICQSPSFWWERERFRDLLPPKPAVSPDYWICVGDQEIERGVTHGPSGLRQDSHQIEACERTRDVLLQRGYCVAYRTYSGGHDPRCWKTDLELALPWALSRG